MTVISSPALKESSSEEPAKLYKALTSFFSCREGGFRIRPLVLDDSMGKSAGLTLGDFRENDLELGGRESSGASTPSFSSSSLINAVKVSRSFFPSPAIELTALEAHPVTLILLLSFVILSFPTAVTLLSERLREAREVGREAVIDLSASDLRRTGVRTPESSPDSTDEVRFESVERLERIVRHLSLSAREKACGWELILVSSNFVNVKLSPVRQ